MNTETGKITEMTADAFKALPPEERAKFVPIGRPLTVREHHRQKIDMYAPCGCGSGKKFKFCCHKKP